MRWVKAVLFSGGRQERLFCSDGQDDIPVMLACRLAENMRQWFEKCGPVSLRQFIGYYMDISNHGRGEKEKLGRETFWTKKNMEVTRGLVAAGFTLKPRE